MAYSDVATCLAYRHSLHERFLTLYSNVTGTTVCWYTGIPVRRYTNILVHKYTGAQVHCYTGTSVFMYLTGTPVFMYLGISVQSYLLCQHIGITVHLYSDACAGKLAYSDVATRLVYRHFVHDPFPFTIRVTLGRTYVVIPVLLYTGTPLPWCTSILVHKYTDTPVYLYSCTSAHGYEFRMVYQYFGMTVHLYTAACTW